MAKIIVTSLFVVVSLTFGTSACGFDCESKCKSDVHLLWEPGRGTVPSATVCTVDAVVDASSCEKCDAALAAEVGQPLDKSTCE
jgi:hypothetical protein